jgi:NADH:ubiquinone reductase (H+-translocating)
VTWDVVIAGGGFGGFYAARALERLLPAQSARVTLINDANFMLYTPLLPGAAGATLDPRHVVVPLRSQLQRIELVIGRVRGADPQSKTLSVKRIDGEDMELGYDRLLVALGSVSRTLPIPGLAEHGIGFKSLSDATGLRNQVLNCLDIAESLCEERQIRERLGFVFVGAGYAGVEGLAELQDFAAQAIELYPRCRTLGMRWVLVEAKDRILEEVPDSLARFAADELRGRGIELRTGATVSAIGAGEVELEGGERIPARTVVWTAGVKPSPAVGALGLPLDGEGRIAVDEALRVEGHEHVWAIGDCAAVPDPARPGRPCPPTAQHAVRQGRLAAGNIRATLSGGGQRPFRYKTSGAFAELGSGKAVAITLGIRWRGFPAWLLARTYHLLLMPGLGRKLRLLVDWNVALLFGRDISAPGRLGSPTPLDGAADAE